MEAESEPRTALVTGATSGIGRETARALTERGFRVVVGARDAARGRALVDEIAGNGGRAELLEIDLASFDSIRRAAARLAREHESLDVLVNNAGIVSRERRTTADGHELTWQTNFLGHVLLTCLLLPLLRKARAPRVVNVSSKAHFSGRIRWEDPELSQGYGGLKAYAQSKLAQVLFTRELARREPGLTVVALHPGTISTNIWRAAPAPLAWLLRAVLPRAEKGARPVVRLAADPHIHGATGRYFDRFREIHPSREAQNDADAVRLWDLAQSAAGFPPAFEDHPPPFQ